LAHAKCLASFQIPSAIVESNAAPQDDNSAGNNEPLKAVATAEVEGVRAVEGIEAAEGSKRDGVEVDDDDDDDDDGDEIAALEKFVELLNL
jgi:hypothetical protein